MSEIENKEVNNEQGAEVDANIVQDTPAESEFLHENPLVAAVIQRARENGIEVEIISEVEELVEDLSSKTKMELIMARKEIEDAESMQEVIDELKSTATNMESASEALESLTLLEDLDDSVEKDETGDAKASAELESVVNELNTDISLAKIAYDVVYENYINTHPTTTVYEDLLEKLLKDKSTLEKSSSVNAPKLIEKIDEVIAAMQANDISALIGSFMSKTENEKRLRELAKELVSIKRPVYYDLGQIGISQDDIVKFVRFFVTEDLFRHTHNFGKEYNVDSQLMPNVCLFFMFHLHKIIKNSRKRATYETLKYRLAFMHIIDICNKFPSNSIDEPSRFMPVNEGDENAERVPSELSIVRGDAYDAFMPLFERYYSIMKDKTLVKYAEARARKTK